MCAALIGVIASWQLWWGATGFYYEYSFYPRVKAADGYSYPEVRYLIFDCVAALWSLLGLAACALLFRYLITRNMHRWTARLVMAFAALFVVLVTGIFFGTMLRSAGF